MHILRVWLDFDNHRQCYHEISEQWFSIYTCVILTIITQNLNTQWRHTCRPMKLHLKPCHDVVFCFIKSMGNISLNLEEHNIE